MKSTKKKKHTKNKTKKNIICAPSTEESYTCFTKKALINIIKSWNDYYKDNKLEFKKSDTKKLLWSKLNEKLNDKCSNDYCWTKQDFLTESKNKLQTRYFRPKKPKKWQSNEREWLNTYDINNVMKQYEKKYKNFHFIGAVPMDFDKKLSFGSCVIDELCNINLKQLLNKGKSKIGVILNLDNHDQEGSHWVSLFCDFDSNNIYYFDSYGYKESNEIRNLMNRLQQQGKELNKDIKIHINNNRHQYKGSECGVYSINFIERLLKNESFDTISNIITKDDDMFNNRQKYFLDEKNI
jgi:hypothetical protein